MESNPTTKSRLIKRRFQTTLTLQPLQPMAKGRRLGPPDGRHRGGARGRRADDRHLGRSRASAGRDGKKGGPDRCLGRSRGGLTTKIHALVDRQGRPIKLKLTAGQESDIASAPEMIADLPQGAMLLADKGYDANALRDSLAQRNAFANIPPKSNRRDPICFSKYLYKMRNRVERFFNKIKHYRRIATRYDKLAENFKATLQLAAVRIWLRGNESTS
jgi:transposase